MEKFYPLKIRLKHIILQFNYNKSRIEISFTSKFALMH